MEGRTNGGTIFFGNAKMIFLSLRGDDNFLKIIQVLWGSILWTDGRTGRTMFLEHIKSIFFIFDGRTQVFFKKIQTLQGSTDGRTYFLKMPRAFFHLWWAKIQFFLKETKILVFHRRTNGRKDRTNRLVRRTEGWTDGLNGQDGQYFWKMLKAFFSSLMGKDKCFFQKSKFFKLVLASTKACELTSL